MQPSYKIGMFFDSPWWTDTVNTPYPAQIIAYEVTDDVLKALAAKGFPKKYIDAIRAESRDCRNPVHAGGRFRQNGGALHTGAVNRQTGRAVTESFTTQHHRAEHHRHPDPHDRLFRE